MNENEIRELVTSVMRRVAEGNQATQTTDDGKGTLSPEGEIIAEVSARHVHLTQEALDALFGKGTSLTVKRELSQPGQYLSEEKVTLVTMKGSMQKVSVLGPLRSEVQVELSLTDCRALGIEAPVNLSGNHRGAGNVILVGPCGVYEACGSVIAAKAHIHLDPRTASAKGLIDGQSVRVRIRSRRPVCLEDVSVRVNAGYRPAMHIDFDEANACAFEQGDRIEIIP